MTTPPAEMVQRTAEYLRTQSAGRTWLDMWPQVLQARLGLIEALRGVSEEQGRFKPAPEAWSIREVATHVWGDTSAVLVAIRFLAEGRDVPGGPTVGRLVNRDAVSLEEIRRWLAEEGVELSSMVDYLPEEPSLELTYPHPWFGELTCRGWYLFQRVHDLDHTNQIEQIKQAPGYPSA